MEGSTTREQVRALIRDEPMLNLAGIARRVGVSRERVRQIAEEEGLVAPKGVVGVHVHRPPVARLITGGVSVPLSSTVVGTIGELLAAADLAARGFMVFFPLVRTGACDLITLNRSGKTERIEVRCGHRKDGKVRYSFADRSKSDRHAIVITGEPVTYSPPFAYDTETGAFR